MNTFHNRAKSFELECGHVLWLKISPDSAEEFLWCFSCGTYRQLLHASVNLERTWVYHPQWDFKSKRVKRSVYHGQCTVEDCVYRLRNVYGFKVLRNKMHSHYMKAHTNRGIVIQYADQLPANSEPPF